MLMVLAAPGEFKAGVSRQGQTCEHALLAYTLGVKQLLLCVNKMDLTKSTYSQRHFEEVVRDVSLYLHRITTRLLPGRGALHAQLWLGWGERHPAQPQDAVVQRLEGQTEGRLLEGADAPGSAGFSPAACAAQYQTPEGASAGCLQDRRNWHCTSGEDRDRASSDQA